MRSIRCVVLLAPVLCACGGATGPSPPAAQAPSGVRADGSLTFALTGNAPGDGLLSAPLLPDSGRFDASDGMAYPANQADQSALVQKGVHVFADLLVACQPGYPDITLPVQGGPALTPEQLATNYNQVARCAYQQYGVKPYWIPQLIDDVDACGLLLGAGWRLPNEADVMGFTAAQLQQLEDTLTGVAKFDSLNGSGASWGTFYFALKVYVRRNDGSLAFGFLAPGAPARLAPLGVDGAHYKDLLVDGAGDNAALRCLRMR